MIYGNTVGHERGNRARNLAVLVEHLTIDIAQLRRPTGHAVNPIPLTEARRIPTADEIVEVQRIGREIEHVVRRSPELFDWARLEGLARRAAEHGASFRDRVLAHFDADGVNVNDAGELLLAMRQIEPQRLELALAFEAPADLGNRGRARRSPSWCTRSTRRVETSKVSASWSPCSKCTMSCAMR